MSKPEPKDTPDIVKRVIAAMGTQQALADGLGIKSPSISDWTQIPHMRVLRIEALTGISRHELRPDIYPRESRRKAGSR